MLEPERIIRLEDDCVVVLDQRRLPDEEAELITAIVTEHGVHHAPYAEFLAGAVAGTSGSWGQER